LDAEVIALLDTGAEASVISEELFNSLTEEGLKILHIPVVNCVLSSAFGRSRRIRKQALIEFQVEGDLYEQVIMVVPQLVTELILGNDFFYDYQVNLDFASGSLGLREMELQEYTAFMT